jgi:hypothetical protein
MHATVQPSGLNQSYTSLPGAGSGNPFGSGSNSSLSLGRYASSVSVSGPTTPYSHPYGHAVAAGHGIGRKQVIHHTHQQLPSIHDISKDWDDGQDVHMDGANPTYRVVSRANHPSTKFRDSELTFFFALARRNLRAVETVIQRSRHSPTSPLWPTVRPRVLDRQATPPRSSSHSRINTPHISSLCNIEQSNQAPYIGTRDLSINVGPSLPRLTLPTTVSEGR